MHTSLTRIDNDDQSDADVLKKGELVLHSILHLVEKTKMTILTGLQSKL